MLVSIIEIRKRCENIFLKVGLKKEDAKIITDVLLQTEMRGVFTHGFFRVPNYETVLSLVELKRVEN